MRQKCHRKLSRNFWQKEAAEWIEKNIGDDVICAWRQPLKGEKYKDEYDASVLTEGQSRLCNFYVEGLDYLVKNVDIDGIYIDDTAYDRTTMKRVRKILDKKKARLSISISGIIFSPQRETPLRCIWSFTLTLTDAG